MKMKTFRLIVATRLALFPLIFNLSFAQKVEIDSDESEKISFDSSEPHPDPLLLGEGNHEVVGEVCTPTDFSAIPRNDNEDAQDSLREASE
jgi:hypothetical protein